MRGRSVFDFFHPDEVPFARSIHSRGVLLDKAASLHYVRILSVGGQWVSCECCFTVVHDVLVACTSIYRRGEKSERRAIDGAQVRRIFSSSPRDPRYHMLEHLSPKFKVPPVEREPRAALILNRFTRNLTVMFATNAIATVFGLEPEQMKDKSFYRCIQERCLPDALNCLESAKANDSIAYLRFWSRDPRDEDEDEDENMDDAQSSPSDSDEGGAALDAQMDIDGVKQEEGKAWMNAMPATSGQASSRSNNNNNNNELPLAADLQAQVDPQGDNRRRRRRPLPSIELEAVVSCTSDGLVVILRRARPVIPPSHPPSAPSPWRFENGLFAAPWAQQPVQPYVSPETIYTFRAPLMPQYMPLRGDVKEAGGPPMDHLMRSIRDVAVFAWALVGINGNLASYTHGRPRDEAAPSGGLPIWDPNAVGSTHQPPENQAFAKWTALDQRAAMEQRSWIPQAIQPTGGYYTASSSAYGQGHAGSSAYGQASGNAYMPGYHAQQRDPRSFQSENLSGSTVVPESNDPNGFAVPRTQPEQPRDFDRSQTNNANGSAFPTTRPEQSHNYNRRWQ